MDGRRLDTGNTMIEMMIDLGIIIACGIVVGYMLHVLEELFN
jgi:hypothetical protein